MFVLRRGTLTVTFFFLHSVASNKKWAVWKALKIFTHIGIGKIATSINGNKKKQQHSTTIKQDSIQYEMEGIAVSLVANVFAFNCLKPRVMHTKTHKDTGKRHSIRPVCFMTMWMCYYLSWYSYILTIKVKMATGKIKKKIIHSVQYNHIHSTFNIWNGIKRLQ